jgi:hypothetical protein
LHAATENYLAHSFLSRFGRKLIEIKATNSKQWPVLSIPFYGAFVHTNKIPIYISEQKTNAQMAPNAGALNIYMPVQ